MPKGIYNDVCAKLEPLKIRLEWSIMGKGYRKRFHYF